MCAEYPQYTVEFSGVGQPPPETSHVGCCSQMATFTRTGMQPTQCVCVCCLLFAIDSFRFIEDVGAPYKIVSLMPCGTTIMMS